MTITDLRELCLRALPATGGVVDLAVTDPEQLGRPTPCAGWTLVDLLAHMTGQNHGFAEAIETGDAPAAAFAPRPSDPGAAARDWHAGAGRLAAALTAAPSDRWVRLVEISPGRRFPVAAVAGFQLLDTLVHGWDVATALGRPFRPGDDLLPALREQAALIPDTARTGVDPAFAAVRRNPRPGDDWWADVLALTGRTPPGDQGPG